jgi:hypothetical protein
LRIPFWKLMINAPSRARSAISSAASAVALLLTHSAMTSASASAAGSVR